MVGALVGKLGLGKIKNVAKISFKIFQEFYIKYHIVGSINFHNPILE